MILHNLLPVADDEPYDLLVAALGFEARATAVAKHFFDRYKKGCAIGFDHHRSCSYDVNLEWYKAEKFNIIEDVSTDDFPRVLVREIGEHLAAGEGKPQLRPFRIAIDISCLDRRRLADVVHWTRTQSVRGVIVDFWYCIGAFVAPTLTSGRNEIAGPIHRRFAGRFTEPGRPLALLAGLGYELGRVMGAAEYLQASRIVAFLPESPIQEYEGEVLKANDTMLADLESRQVLRYPVGNPERTIAMLDSTIRGLSERYNVVLLPGGPKIFALCSLIVQTLHKESAVWRVSSGTSIRAREVLPSDYFVGLRWMAEADSI
jgi:hypothetical protein